MTFTRVWPSELEGYKNNPNAIPMASGEFTNICPNCGGHEMMMVYVIQEGPKRFPFGGKCKWLELDDPVWETITDKEGNAIQIRRDGPRTGWYTGELKTAPCPACQSGRMENYIVRNCGLEGQDLCISLEDFRTKGDYQAKTSALQAARNLLGLGYNPKGFITFLGAYGVGKTHLLKGLVNGFRQIKIMAKYTTLADLLADIREKFGEQGGRPEDVIADYRRARVLCLDEIDKVNLTGWAKETFFRLIDSRWSESSSLLTVMASNLTPDQFPPELGYLGSRINGGVVVNVAGPDVREAQGLKAQMAMNAGR